MTLLDRLLSSDISVAILNKQELSEAADGYFVSFIAEGKELKRLYISPETEKQYIETIPLRGSLPFLCILIKTSPLIVTGFTSK